MSTLQAIELSSEYDSAGRKIWKNALNVPTDMNSRMAQIADIKASRAAAIKANEVALKPYAQFIRRCEDPAGNEINRKIYPDFVDSLNELTRQQKDKFIHSE